MLRRVIMLTEANAAFHSTHTQRSDSLPLFIYLRIQRKALMDKNKICFSELMRYPKIPRKLLICMENGQPDSPLQGVGPYPHLTHPPK